MTATWVLIGRDIAWSASAKYMLSIFNGVGSGKIVRVYRIWVLNNQSVAVTGVFPVYDIRRITAQSGVTAVAPVPYDTASTAIPAQITCGTVGTITMTDVFRRFVFSSDEPRTNAALSQDEIEAIPALSLIWDAGYGDSNVESIVCREGYGVVIYCAGIASAAGIVDILIEFTVT